MSRFKVGDNVVSSYDGYSGATGWPNGKVVSTPNGNSNLYKVVFDGDKDWPRGLSHFDSELTFASSPHYTPDSTGKDYLARCEDTFSREEMIGAYRFTLGKYVDRMGKKTGEPVEKELAKIIDYATRARAWLERS